ncbi:hypothetical protein VIN01S_08290 [Vibrio inusitatus NBRC 102082]|uniref:Uncharacterized protein n=1 Tax=Vibrio inusitatus NBRC 102082 TaxID=1219070 RepID=A0A4Y3HSN4_9VIBR|nr:hypothetical protein VIN01S_08290 [Vibrio inusitatus NBRC 102082]
MKAITQYKEHFFRFLSVLKFSRTAILNVFTNNATSEVTVMKAIRQKIITLAFSQIEAQLNNNRDSRVVCLSSLSSYRLHYG